MKGIVFNLLEEVVVARYGEATWDDLLDAADLSGAYTSLGSYPDDDLARVVGAASAALDMPADEIVRWFGRSAIELLAARYPAFFAPHASTRPFVLTLNDIIHPEVRKLYPGADVPVFDFDATSDDALTLDYRSARKMCSFALGLIEGASDHFGERLVFAEPRCMHRGDEFCRFVLGWERGDGATPAPAPSGAREQSR